DPVAQVVQVQPACGVVLAQQRDQTLAVGVPERRAPSGRRTAPVLAHADGVVTTAVPAATTSAPSSFAFSIIRSIACLRASSRTAVNCRTSPWRSDEIPPATVLLKPMARTTRPNVMPSFRSTIAPGSSNAVVTGKAAAVDSGVPAALVVSVMHCSTP